MRPLALERELLEDQNVVEAVKRVRLRNFIRRPGCWASVDWEYGGWGDPAFDAAQWATHASYVEVPPSHWAWALDTPFPYWKRWAGEEGGVADMMLLSWPAKIDPSDQIRDQYLHAVDVVPTLYELLGIEPPYRRRGLPAATAPAVTPWWIQPQGPVPIPPDRDGTAGTDR